jgi:hypothetical protein
MNDLRTAMPILARHEGVWEGHYRYFDAEGALIDQHASRLICRFPEDGPYPYHQTSIYRWADGRTETRDFPATWSEGRLNWSGDGSSGWAIEVSEDPRARTLMLYWARKDAPNAYLYELIQISDCGRYRSRVGQWIEDGRVRMRTLIDEQKVEQP